MGDEFHSNGGEQNIAQGQNAIGKQVNNLNRLYSQKDGGKVALKCLSA